MNYIQPTANPTGAYPAPQSAPAPGLAAFPDEFHEAFYAHNGFVTLTIENGTVTAMEPNLEAWEAWKVSLPPEPEPTPDPQEQLRADVDYLSVMTGVSL